MTSYIHIFRDMLYSWSTRHVAGEVRFWGEDNGDTCEPVTHSHQSSWSWSRQNRHDSMQQISRSLYKHKDIDCTSIHVPRYARYAGELWVLHYRWAFNFFFGGGSIWIIFSSSLHALKIIEVSQKLPNCSKLEMKGHTSKIAFYRYLVYKVQTISQKF